MTEFTTDKHKVILYTTGKVEVSCAKCGQIVLVDKLDGTQNLSEKQVCERLFTDTGTVLATDKFGRKFPCDCKPAKKHGWISNKPHACCDDAIAIACVCAYAYSCPHHGQTHIGTHD